MLVCGLDVMELKLKARTSRKEDRRPASSIWHQGAGAGVNLSETDRPKALQEWALGLSLSLGDQMDAAVSCETRALCLASAREQEHGGCCYIVYIAILLVDL
jgi:hypothetical protein